jgi:uncharacterized RDD family membrane protein YckC
VAEFPLNGIEPLQIDAITTHLSTIGVKWTRRNNVLFVAESDADRTDSAFVQAAVTLADPAHGAVAVLRRRRHTQQRSAHSEPRRAARWRRLVGSIVDHIVIGLLVLEASALAFSRGSDTDRPAAAAAVVFAAWLVALVLVVVWPTATTGRSVGKWVTGTRVVSSIGLHAPGWRRSVGRTVVSISPWMVSTVWFKFATATGAGWILVGAQIAVFSGVTFGLRGRGLHDRAAATVVLTAAFRPVAAGDQFG